MKNNFLLSLFCLSALMLIQACHNPENTVQVKTHLVSDSLLKIITIDTVKELPVNNQLKLSGEVGYDENRIVKVFPNSSGQVMQVNVSFGDYVHKGQVLATIKSADVAGNYSDLTNAEADVRIAKRQYENAKSLFESGISSQREMEEAKINYEKAMAVAGKINTQISINGGGHTAPGGIYHITAPANGYLVEKKVAAGAFIRNDMTDNLFTISDLREVWVWANVYESDIAKVKPGYTAKISTLAYPNKVFYGKVDKVNDLIDPSNKSLRLRITLKNDSLFLKPQMFANVIISSQDEKSALAIPTSSIVTDNGKNFVVVFHNVDDVKVNPVEVLKSDGSISYINTGLQAGDRIISQNQLLIYNAIAGK